jgi:peptidoglycan/xylan/chitin deacetylase (PgdA/CDA1 family)
MHKIFKTSAYFLCLTFLTGCSAKLTQEKEFNAYLPPSYSEFEVSERVRPIEQIPTNNDEVWDVSDVDISYVDPNKKLISFTFDDGPSKTMENILAVFADYNEQNPDCIATATFFLNGGYITNDALPLLHTARILGCELGNHTHRHHNLTTLPSDEVQSEIQSTDELLAKIDGKPLHLLRPPFGLISHSLKTQLNTPVINWTIDTLDWTGVSDEEIYNAVFNARFSGAIVLMHDGYPATVDALKRLLPDLKADGYQVVSVSALAKSHGCTLYNKKEYIRARKQ